MDDCLFCKIIKGEIPSYTVYENDKIKAFLDINPVTNGHCVIIPKKHIVDVQEIDSEISKEIDEASKKIIEMYKSKLNIDGATRIQNNGYGQEIKHYHMHIIPRYENDNIYTNRCPENLIPVEEAFKKINNN